MLRASPKSLKSQATFSIKQGTVFKHGCAPYFYVEQGSLSYSLSKASPSWLMINPQTGVVWGKAPSVYTAKTYLVTVIAKNAVGLAEWKFYLTVTREDFAHQIDPLIQHHLDKKYQKQLAETYNPELLEYVYAYLEQSDNPDAFFEQLRETAQKLGLVINKPVNYQDFAKIVKMLVPDIQASLAAELPPHSPLPNAQVSVFDLQNLFRQGSQPSGALAGPVFNYFAAPTRHIWSIHIKNILNSAGLAIIEQQQKKQLQVESASPTNRQTVLSSEPKPS